MQLCGISITRERESQREPEGARAQHRRSAGFCRNALLRPLRTGAAGGSAHYEHQCSNPHVKKDASSIYADGWMIMRWYAHFVSFR